MAPPSATTEAREAPAAEPGRPRSPPKPHTRAFRIAATALFALAVVAMLWAARAQGLVDIHPLLAAGFVAFGLFAILCGFPHPYYGHVSFDRLAQYSALLIFGPVLAALLNGLASLLYPWRKLADKEPPTRILMTSLANAGMMVLVILISGGIYLSLDGRLPLSSLRQSDIVPLAAMAIAAHVLNELFLGLLLWCQGGDVRKLPSLFEYSVEIGAFAGAVILAIAYNRLDTGSLALLIALTLLAMSLLHRFALLRRSLEDQVNQRTRELQDKTRELEQQARHDVLTGLFNRRYVDQRLLEQISVCQLHGQALCIAMADLDHFKQVNDRYSHQVGDDALRRCAKIFLDNLRETDIVARYGGEEFLLCLPNTQADQARQVCERIRHACAMHDWSSLQKGMHLTISIGMAEMSEAHDRDGLLQLADERLYKAKRAGRNRVVSA